MKKLPFQGASVLLWETKEKKARGIYFLSQGSVEVAVLILMLTVFVIGIIAQWWLKSGHETVWKIQHQNAGWENMRPLFWKYGLPLPWQVEQFNLEERLVFVWDVVIQRDQWSTREERAFLCSGKWRNTKDTELRITKGERRWCERQQGKQRRSVKQHKIVLWFCDLM